jgi:nucleotide-binding universal stress UspA family protein
MVADYGQGLTVTKIIKSGEIKFEILETAKTWDASVIVLGTHGRTGLDHFLLGSMAESITRHADCPVLIVPNKAIES